MNLKDKLLSLLPYPFYYAVFLALASPTLFRRIQSTDLWKALYTGRYLAIFNAFPHHGTFTFSPVNHYLTRNAFNWLGNVFFVTWYDWTGLIGLQSLRVLVVLIAALVLHSMIQYRLDPLMLLGLAGFALGIHQKLLLRTALICVPAITLLIWIWNHAHTKERIQPLYLLPVLFVVWGNSHGSYQIGITLFLAMIVGSFIDQLFTTDQPSRRWVLHATIVFLLSFVSVSIVKPFPETQLLDRYGSILPRMVQTPDSLSRPTHGNSVTHSPDDPARASDSLHTENSERNQTLHRSQIVQIVNLGFLGNNLRQALEALRALILPDRPARSHEFYFPLSLTHFLMVKLAFAWIAVATAVFLIYWRSFYWTEFLPALTATLLGLCFIRAVPYIPLTLFPIILSKVNREKFPVTLNPFLYHYSFILIIAVTLGIVGSFVYRGQAGAMTGDPKLEMGTGAIQRYRSSLPTTITRDYPRERFFNGYAIGSYLIWKWWPYKRVFQDTKLSAYTLRFQQSRARLPLKNLLGQWKLDHAVISREYLGNTRFFLFSKRWVAFARNGGLVGYRKK